MAATVRSQQSSSPNPQLKKLVYSKYRELLGSYNDKANSIIQSLPAYMVTEDRGFHNLNLNTNDHDVDDDDDVDDIDKAIYPSNCMSEAPACVQNAMMTKDKKPFTYTPGGIDLSQIKSPRMAKRIARNAQYEGVTGPAKPSPLAQPTDVAQKNLSAGALGAQAVGMPVQVFPTGPPPPPPPSGAGIPPPPPPQNKNQLGVQANGLDARRSPTPQNFEPPPLGCRPEIKIPPNPMANLKKVPKPREKNDFWIEEYRKERSASPMVTDDANRMPKQNENYQQNEQNSELYAPVNISNSAMTNQQSTPPSSAREYQHVESPKPQEKYSSNQQIPVRQNGERFVQTPQTQENKFENFYQPSSPTRDDRQLQQQPQTTFNEKQQISTPSRFQYHTQIPNNAPPIQQQKNIQTGSIYVPPISQDNSNINQQQSPILQQQQQRSPPIQQYQQRSPPVQQQQQQAQQMKSPPIQQQQPQQLRSPPIQQQHQPQQQQQRPIQADNPPTPRWMAQRPPMREVPEWVRDDSNPSPSSPIRNTQAMDSPVQFISAQSSPVTSTQHIQSFTSNTPSTNSSNNTTLRIQITPKSNSNAKERIIPIQLEQTPPTPSRTPGTPNLGPQPFYGSTASSGSTYSSPNSGYNTPSQTINTRKSNQFVDQGYNNIPTRWATLPRASSSASTQPSPPPSSASSTASSGTRVIPIAIEGQNDDPFNQNYSRGPVSSAPLVIQNGNYRLFVHDCPLEAEIRYRKSRLSDPRTLQHQNSWGGSGGQPNQSKSFRILQKITDTEDKSYANNNQTYNQRPQYLRQMSSTSSGGSSGSGGNDVPTDQMRKIQLNDHDQNRVRNKDQSYIHPSEQQVPEPKMYTGSAIPSRSFRLLQAMTTPENAGPGQSDV